MDLLKEFDKNSDGEISRYEFRDMMKALVRNKNVNSTKPVLNSTHSKLLTNRCHPKGGDIGVLKRTSMSKPIRR